jgi:hypothetical protein
MSLQRSIVAPTVFVGAALLFLVEPLIARTILPWFGGSAATWTTCMLFFQVLLLAGYGYAHVLATYVSPRRQVIVHGVVLVAAAAFLPIVPSPAWQPNAGQSPILRIVLVLGATVGLPFFALAGSGPLLQKWFAVAAPGRKPYRLYALSNLGSMLALLGYPILFEPWLHLRTQAVVWSGGFILFGCLCLLSARGTWRGGSAGPAAWSQPQPAKMVSARDLFLWLALATTGSLLLLAVTNQISQDIAIVPMLWVVPLAIYLLTFIVSFDGHWYRRWLFAGLFPLAAFAALYAIQAGIDVPLFTQIAIYAVTLFICCMICHGELARAKPDPRHLTLYYLTIAAGGALGGLLIAVVAPLVLNRLVEMEIGLVVCGLLLSWIYYHDTSGRLAGGRPRWAWGMIAILFAALMAYTGMVLNDLHIAPTHNGTGRFTGYSLAGPQMRVLDRSRNFYGTLTVLGARWQWGRYNLLLHGRITHGQQFLQEPYRHIPLTYYSKGSGIDLAMSLFPRQLAGGSRRPLRIGAIGLGVGTIAAYVQPGDSICFYEINPDVVRIARDYFSYLQDAADKGATITIALGDGRLSLAHEIAGPGLPAASAYDILVVDAFTGDAIPMHLLTRQCFAIYDQRLQRDGVLAFHVSNRFLDLRPVVRTLSRELGMQVFQVDSPGTDNFITHSLWLLATRNPQLIAALPNAAGCMNYGAQSIPDVAWTDDYGSILSVLSARGINMSGPLSPVPEGAAAP